MYARNSLVLISLHQTRRHHIPVDIILSTAWETFTKIYALSLSLFQIISPCINVSLYVGNLKVGYYVLNLKVTL